MMRTFFFMMLMMLCVSEAQATPPCFGFIGEKLSFNVGWEFINAGSATMVVGESKTGGYNIQVHARTNKFLDLFKKVRDTITSQGVCLGNQTQSTLFQLRQHERSYRANKKTIFDWQHGKVLYTEHDKTDVYPVPKGHMNVMDAFFRVRAMDLRLGQEIHLPVFDSRKVYDVVVHIGKKTKMIRAPWGERVECISIEPQLKTEGIFSSPGKMKIWVTDDARHIPLKLVAKIKIGRIIGRLTQYQEPM
ncbi:MAG: DUF3108 domain-containing protein [Zetaproteobacteria bacterium]|nr:DUF3108 domain-containing protein [Zetaproteobacteria bacterium]